MNSSTRRSVLGAAALLPLAVGSTAALAEGSAGDHKPRLLIHVSENDPARWNMALGNARNAQDEMGGPDKIDIEIVSNGPSVMMLKTDSPIAGRVAEATRSGVKVMVCENSMKGFKLEKSTMLPSVNYVPAGIIELMKKQQDGWAYVRP